MSEAKPTSIYTAFGAQPAEAELTDEDIKKFDLFTQAEIDSFMHWEMELIRQTPFDAVKGMVDTIREMQRDRELRQLPTKSTDD